MPKNHHLDKYAAKLAAEGEAAGDRDDLLDTWQVADWFRISPQWLEIGRVKGREYGPPYEKLSDKRLRYRRGAVIDWLKERAARVPSGREAEMIAARRTKNLAVQTRLRADIQAAAEVLAKLEAQYSDAAE